MGAKKTKGWGVGHGQHPLQFRLRLVAAADRFVRAFLKTSFGQCRHRVSQFYDFLVFHKFRPEVVGQFRRLNANKPVMFLELLIWW